jgi:xanthine dehydrogenase iron-sulfur cluster and FAD-binding subunit A
MNEMTNSHILMHEFEYLRPGTVQNAMELLSQFGSRARILAGGTDLIVQIKMERLAPEYLIDITGIAKLDGITVRDGAVHIGTRTSIRAIRNAPLIQVDYPALAEACAAFSTTQVQVMGTLGGNLCNGSPASDSAPALIAFGAQVVLESSTGKRTLPLEDFFLGPGKTAIREGELLTALVLQPPQPSTGSVFLKASRVAADIAKVNAAVVLTRDDDGGRIGDCRLVLGSVAPTPVRAKKAEALLSGKVFTPELVAEAAQVASQEVVPIDDVRSTAAYRREVARVLVYDGLHRAWNRAGRGDDLDRKAHLRTTARESGPTRAKAAGSASTAPARRSASGEHDIELWVNGIKRSLRVRSNDLLLNVLRDELELTGAKYGCGIGECGACTVLVNGKPVLSCLMLAASAHGSEIITVEGLRGPEGELDPLQDAFIEHQAFQCGYCTPGMLMTAKSLLDESPSPTEADVREYLKGNLCRCTGYARIVQAVMSVADSPVTHPAAETV